MRNQQSRWYAITTSSRLKSLSSLEFGLETTQLVQPLNGTFGLALYPLQQFFARGDILDKTHDNPSRPNAIVRVTDLIHDLRNAKPTAQ